LTVFGDDRDAVVHRVQFGFLALTSCTGVGWILADREAHPFRAFAPLQVVRAFRVSFFPAAHDDYGGFYSSVRREHDAAIPPSMRCFDSFGEIDFSVGHW
jgi:hypothetical protein